jgi:DNA-binding transcriptional LysR family regulator
VQDVVELDELQGIVGLVAHGVGVALVPQAAALHMPETVSALSLGDETFTREIGLVQRNTRNEQTATVQFAGSVCAVLPR